MAEAVRPKSKKKKAKIKNPKSKSNAPLLNFEEDSSVKLASESEEVLKAKDENAQIDSAPSDIEHAEDKRDLDGNIQQEDDDIACLDPNVTRDPASTEPPKPEDVTIDRTSGDEESGDDMEKWMDKHEEKTLATSEETKEQDEPEDEFKDAVSSLQDTCQSDEISSAASVLPSLTESSMQDDTVYEEQSIAELATQHSCKDEVKEECDVVSPTMEDGQLREATVEDGDVNVISLTKEDSELRDDSTQQESAEAETGEVMPEDIKDADGMVENKEVLEREESLEEFEVLSALSRETSLEESQMPSVEATDECIPSEPDEATAPPAAEVLTPEASAPPTESPIFDPLGINQIQQETQSVDSVQQPQGSTEMAEGDTGMGTAPLLAVASEEEPHSSSMTQGEKEATRSEGWKNISARSRGVAAWPTESMQPMSEQELQYYYFNSMLTKQDAFVEDFVKGNYIDKHEFYDLVNSYLRARQNVGTIQAEVKGHREDYMDNVEQIWTFTQNEIPVKGQCQDDVNVKCTHTFKTVEYHERKLKAAEHALSQLRLHIHGTYALVTYTAQLSRLQIEVYIYHLFQRSQLFKGIDNIMPVTAYLMNMNSVDAQADINKLKQCISVLFAFQRRPITDQEFIQLSRSWLQKMISMLLRVATLEDHLFIFNHLLRCPPGISEWASTFLQISSPVPHHEVPKDTQLLSMEDAASSTSSTGQGSHGFWNSPLLDHFVNMLATIMTPVRYREEFLAKMKVVSTNPFASSGSDTSINWTLVDEDLESEDDDSSHKLLLNESDLVDLLVQFPFTEMFSHVLLVNATAERAYNIEHVESQDMLKLIAFSSSLIHIFHTGLQTFSRSRYRQFVKRIGRLIRHTVQYVANHWTNYKTWRVEGCRDSENTILPGSDNQKEITLQRIQLEVDELFFRAVQCIMSTPRLGTWQFLADMPYSCLSPHMMWRLLWFLHHSDKGEVSSTASINVRTRAKLDEYKWDLSDSTKKAHFGNKLLNMPMSEVIYLLTTFANMASARSNKETGFVITITNEVYELAYLNKYTRDSCSKVGRELLAGMALTHPFILTNILSLIQSSMDIIGSMSVYLCSELPVYLWQPSVSDMSFLRVWILDHSPDSTENQLARLILSKLNWGYNEQEDELVLDISLHRKVAILVMEAFTKHIAERAQGAFIASTVSWGISVVLGDVVNLDVWCWDLLNKLRLHSQDQPTPILCASGHSAEASGGHRSKAAEAGIIQSDRRMSSSGRDFSAPDLTSDPILYPVNKALDSNIPLACYIAVAMTRAGHNLEDFLTKGLEYLQNLVTAGCYRMCIPLIGKIVPTFIQTGHQEYLLKSVKFISLIETILTADHQYSRILQKLSMSFQTECTALFSSMIATLLQTTKAPGSTPGLTETLFEFWLMILTSCKNWHTNHDICQVLDATLEAALACHKASNVLTQEIFMTHFRKKVPASRAPGLLSSVMSLVSSSSPLPTMVEQHKKEFPWLAYSLMSAETRFLQESGVLQVVSQELYRNSSMTTDQALKRANQQLKSNFLVNVNQLPIYRWAQLALDVEISHPLLPLIWQMFFTLYLERMKAPGGTLERFSIGHRYFLCLSDVTFLKKLKRQLSRIADYHHNASQGHYPEGKAPLRNRVTSQSSKAEGSTVEGAVGGAAGEDEVEDNGMSSKDREDFETLADKEFHIKLLRLYQTYLLWLEEPLLHEASLYLPSLPEQYDREKLARIFAADMDAWMEYVDWDGVSYGVERLVTQWLQVTRPPIYKNNGLNARDQEIDATTQILNRLAQYEEPKSAPVVEPTLAPVGDIPESLLVDHQAMLEFIDGDLQEMLTYANSFATRESFNVGLDLSYVELLPTLYHNSEIETRLEVPCRSVVSTRHRCSGPAKIVLRHKECKVSDAVKRKLDENRTEYKQLSIETESPPPPVICTAAVHIENAITDLINSYRSSDGEEKDAHVQVGVALLYHLANKMNDDCRHYPPTRQFFTSCIEILGQEFVRPFPEQAQPLLHEILTNHKLAGVLAPNFVPCNCPSTFTHMYTEVVRATANNMQDLAFMLLTKFDVGRWLDQHHPTHSTCSHLITTIGEALAACGLGEEVDSKPLPHYEVYRSHLQIVFLYNFPQHYADVMHIVIKGMEEKSLKLKVLEDVLKTIDCPLLPDFGEIGQKQVEKLVQEEPLLSLNELSESLEWLGNYFSRQRHSKQELLQFGLYSHWKDYMPALSSFLGYLALNCVLKEAKRLQENNGNIEQGIKKLWELVLSFYAPWIGPAEAASPSKPGTFQLLPAWSEGDVDGALVIVTLFAETTSFMQALFHNAQQPATTNVLSMFWSYYVRSLAKKEVREDILYAYHRAMSNLPWAEFYPDIYCMESMIKMYESGQESCLLFLASIFPRIQWTGILECIIARGDLQTANQFLSALLSMLIIFGNSLPIMQSQGSNIKVLVAEAQQFPWYLLDESCYHSATMWQLKKSNPRLVLEEQSAGSILSLMRSVAGIGSTEAPNPRLASKQAAYIGLVVGLMCQSSQSREVRAEQFTTPLHSLLYDVTIISSSSAGPSMDSSAHLSSLLTTVLSLLNGCSPITGAPDSIVQGLTTWLATCANSHLVLQIIAVACNTLASTKHMAVIIESCIDSYFATARPPPNDSTHGWAGVVAVLQIPQLSHDEFLSQCLETGAYLTLFAYLSQKLPLCRSLEEETAIHTRLVDWCINCKPSRDNDYKLLLWWYKALELSVRLINFGAPESNVSRSLNNLAPTIMAHGEDRRSSGILGALGFGRHSQLSFRFRLAARSLAVFVMAQLPKEGIRMVANAPGAIVYSSTQRSSRGSSGSIYQGMKLLDSTMENRSYMDLKGITEYVKRFILDGHHCLPDSVRFISYLATQLFPDRACLNVICQQNVNATPS